MLGKGVVGVFFEVLLRKGGVGEGSCWGVFEVLLRKGGVGVFIVVLLLTSMVTNYGCAPVQNSLSEN